MNEQPVLIVISGPTASGKTDYAIRLARYFQTEIISTDSRQVYRGMDIGTAKPTAEQLSEVTHHFIDHVQLTDPYNAGLFETDALSTLEELYKTHRVVVAAGGTGLYIKALCEGLDQLPPVSADLRLQLRSDLEQFGVDTLAKRLRELDPAGASRVDPKNPHRVMRALELVLSTGKPLGELRKGTAVDRPFRIIHVGMETDRQELYQRINQRVESMMKQGLLNEVESLLPYRFENAMNTVGYSELVNYFDGLISLPDAIEKIKQHTRNYAKRQLTWFRTVNYHFNQFTFDPDKI